MKTQLILLDTPIIVSDGEIKIGDLYYDKKLMDVFQAQGSVDYSNKTLSGQNNHFRIIASEYEYPINKKIPQIDFNGFEEKLGIVDVEKIFKDVYGYKQYKPYYDFGFKKAQQLNDKKFSLEDIKKAIGMARESGYCGAGSQADYGVKYTDKGIIDVLSQPKVIDIELEIETINQDYRSDVGQVTMPKITNNKIKITKIL